MRVTFLMAWHLAISECPIILSGEQILIKGNWDSSEILAASAVFPLLGGPDERGLITNQMFQITVFILGPFKKVYYVYNCCVLAKDVWPACLSCMR